jgi:hypothetical protein
MPVYVSSVNDMSVDGMSVNNLSEDEIFVGDKYVYEML